MKHRRRGKEYIVNEASCVAVNKLRFNNNVHNNNRNLPPAPPSDAAVPRHEARPLSGLFLPGLLSFLCLFKDLPRLRVRTSRQARSFLGSLICHTYNTAQSVSYTDPIYFRLGSLFVPTK